MKVPLTFQTNTSKNNKQKIENQNIINIPKYEIYYIVKVQCISKGTIDE